MNGTTYYYVVRARDVTIDFEGFERRAVALPWVSFNTDAASLAPEGLFLERATHPRAYGSLTRVLGSYPKAVRKTSPQPERTDA